MMANSVKEPIASFGIKCVGEGKGGEKSGNGTAQAEDLSVSM